MLFFGASLSSIPWCYSTEILPLRIRAQGTALAVFINWLRVSRPGVYAAGLANQTKGLPYRDDHSYNDCTSQLEVISDIHGLCEFTETTCSHALFELTPGNRLTLSCP